MGKARNLSVLLAADGQVEDAKIDGPMQEYTQMLKKQICVHILLLTLMTQTLHQLV